MEEQLDGGTPMHAFTNPIKKTQDDILKYFNTWDKDDVDCISEIIKERENFSLNRAEI